MISKINHKNTKLGVFSVVWIIITSGTVLFNNDSVVRYTLVLNTLLVLAQLISVRKVLLSRYGNRCILIGLMTVFVALSVIVNSDYASFLTYARLLLIIALALGTSLLVENEVIAATFAKVIVILAGISVIFFYSEFVDRNTSFFPVIVFHEYTYVNAFIYLFFKNIERRNLGIFIEPGLYQIYLNIALFILLYAEKKYRYKYIAVIVLLVAIYSTHSTTGYIMSLLIISGQIFSSELHKKDIMSLVFKVVVVVVTVSLVLISDFFSANIEEKFFGDKHNSFETRKNASAIDYLIIAKNPLTGAGAGTYQNLLDSFNTSNLYIDSSANTFSQLGAQIGVPFVLLILWRVRIYVSRLKIGFVGKWIFFVGYIISFSTEPFVLYPLFYLPVFMSYYARQSRQRVSDRFDDQHHDRIHGWIAPIGQERAS